MKLFTAEQMRKVDREASEAGISAAILLETAGRKVADYALKHWPKAASIVVLCGKGNNGGDGYVAARHLHLAGREVRVLELAKNEAEMRTQESRMARAAYLAHGSCFPLAEQLKEQLNASDLIIDALLGSGLRQPLVADLAAVLDAVNASKRDVLSIDIPSGVQADVAQLKGSHIWAKRTLQLAAPKLASAFYPARAAFGHWDVADIGIPVKLLDLQSECILLDDRFVSQQLNVRKPDIHKYTAGTVLLVAGSAAYLGAAELACRAAYRAGAGLVSLAAEARLPNSWPEIIFEALDWSQEPLASLAAIPEKRAQVRVIGPGLDERAKPYVPGLIAQSQVPTVLDAGALQPSEAWFEAVRRQAHCVLTPHLGEAARLLQTSVQSLAENPLASAQALAKESRAVVVLKGPTTVIASSSKLFVSARGHPGMATGGTGDVLAGLIGAFLASSDDLLLSTVAAVYVHALAGERAARAWADGLIASDLIAHIPLVVQNLLALKDN